MAGIAASNALRRASTTQPAQAAASQTSTFRVSEAATGSYVDWSENRVVTQACTRIMMFQAEAEGSCNRLTSGDKSLLPVWMELHTPGSS